MTLDEAIKHCLEVAEQNDFETRVYDELNKLGNEEYRNNHCQCAADHRQLAEWLTELKELRNSVGAVKLKDMKDAVGLLQELNTENDQLTSQLADAKRLLKAAVEDFPDFTDMWRYADEALALIGKDTNVPASVNDINVGGKKDGWISCKDNMPDTLERGLSTMYSDCCLVCDAFGWVGMAYYITDGQKSWWEFADAQNKNKIDWTEVTHWMPLPKPPKDGEQNE